MPLLTLSGITKSYGAETILENVDLVVHEGDRIGVVGRNGSGKTTLLRIIAGAEPPDRGEISRAREVSLGYLAQMPDLDPACTAVEAALLALDRVRAIEPRLREIEDRLAGSPDGEEAERLLARHARLLEEFERSGGWNLEGRARAVLAGLGLPAPLHDRPTGSLSGGERSRVALARLLLTDPELLLLDEPTNHLDLPGVEWLEEHLVARARGLLVISHDRWFLDRVTTRTLAFHAEGPKLYPASWSGYDALRQQELETLAAEVEKQQAFIRKEKEFIRKHLGSQRSREAKGRRKRLERIELLELPRRAAQGPKLDLTPARRAGQAPLVVQDLAGGYDGRVLFRGLDLTLEPGQRLGIVGANGSGKSTLLRILAGRMKPIAGRVDLGRNVDLGFQDQDHAGVPAGKTIYSTFHDLMPQWTDFEVRSFLARLLFFDEDLDQEVGSLSGGERARVALGLLLLSRPNMLFLDEPTNHLDISARQALERLLAEFRGTLVIVSHDRWFLDRTVERTLWISEAGIHLYPGGYTAAVEARRLRDAEERKARDAERQRQERSKPREPRPSEGPRKKRRPLDVIEAEIIALEERKSALLAALGTAEVYTSGSKVKQHQEQMAVIEAELARLEEEWEGHAGG